MRTGGDYGKSNKADLATTSCCERDAFIGIVPRQPIRLLYSTSFGMLGVFAYLAVQSLSLEKQGWLLVLGIIAIVYNPIIPIHLTREIWPFINILTIGIAMVSIFTLKSKEQKGSRY